VSQAWRRGGKAGGQHFLNRILSAGKMTELGWEGCRQRGINNPLVMPKRGSCSIHLQHQPLRCFGNPIN
jgi:hypothetical protein